jgi:catechol 2,3-dioxygenase-like lactoylglutathione lyase family enzyme
MPDASPLSRIRAIDYSIIYARDMPAMRRFYEEVMRFPVNKVLYEGWVEYRVGANILALAYRTVTADDAPVPAGAAALQLAFRVTPSDVDACAAALEQAGVVIVDPPKDQAWGHRTMFFRDPDGNLLEIYADL